MTTIAKEQSDAVTAALAGNHGFSLISNEKLIQLYTVMVSYRMIEERAQLLADRHPFLADRDSLLGYEAAAAGVAIDLLPDDTVISTANSLIVNFIKGLPLPSLFRPLPVRNIQPTSDSDLDLATRAALNNKMNRNTRIAVVFSGQEPRTLSALHQAIVTAGDLHLPMIFVCPAILPAAPKTNNAQAGPDQITLKAQGCGFPGITVDGGDVVAVYRVATEAIVHARKGNGPTLIECGICPTGNPSEIDPILKMEAYLSRKGLFTGALKREAVAGFRQQLDAAIDEVPANSLP